MNPSFTKSVRKPGGAPDRASTPSITLSRTASHLSVPSDFTERPSPDAAIISKLFPGTKNQAEVVFVIALPLNGSWEPEELILFYGFTVRIQDKLIMLVHFPRELPIEAQDFEEALSALLELAQDVSKAKLLYVIVDNESEEMPDLVHTLLYIGFEVADDAPLAGNAANLLFLEYELDQQ